MKMKNNLVALLTATTLVWVTISGASANEVKTNIKFWIATPVITSKIHENRSDINKSWQDRKQRVKDFCEDAKDDNKDNRVQAQVNWDVLRQDTDKLSEFIKSSLTVEEQSALVTLAKNMADSRVIILSSTDTDTVKIAKLRSTLFTYFAGVKTYVATEKLADFNVFVTARIALFDTNSALRFENKANITECKDARKDMKEEIKSKAKDIKHVLSVHTRNALSLRLDAIPTESKEVFYQKVIDRIDLILVEPRSERVKTILLEIKSIIQVRLEAFQVGISEIEVMNEVLAQ